MNKKRLSWLVLIALVVNVLFTSMILVTTTEVHAAPVSTLPFTEDFNGTTFAVAGGVLTSSIWITDGFKAVATTTSSGAFTTGKAMKLYASGANTDPNGASVYLPIDATNFTELNVSFLYKKIKKAGANGGDAWVDISYDDGATYSKILEMPYADILATDESFTTLAYKLDLSANNNSKVRLRFAAKNGNAETFYAVEDLQVTGKSTDGTVSTPAPTVAPVAKATPTPAPDLDAIDNSVKIVDGPYNPDKFGTSRFENVRTTKDITFNTTIPRRYDPTTNSYINAAPTVLKLDVYEPAGDSAAKRPVILWIHGGGFRTDSTKLQNYIVQYSMEFARRGYTCVSIDYRLTYTSSDKHESEMPGLQDAARDANIALDWIRANSGKYRMDPNYIFVAGGSAGGRTAITVSEFDGPDKDAVMESDLKYKDKPWNKNGIVANAILWGGLEEDVREWVYPYLDKNSKPTVLIHGEADTTIPVQNSKDLYAAMQTKGISSELYIIPGAQHTPTGNSTNPKIWTWMSDFFITEWKKQLGMTAEGKFVDLDTHAWAKEQVNFLAEKGIVYGTSTKLYSPAENVTRADFMAFLVRTLGLKAEFDTNFVDVNKTDKYYTELGIAKKLGIANGIGNDMYNPTAQITRQDLMLLTYRALNKVGKLSVVGTAVDLDKFSDKDGVKDYALEGVASMVKDGLIKGNGELLNPIGNATRAETAVIMDRIYKK